MRFDNSFIKANVVKKLKEEQNQIILYGAGAKGNELLGLFETDLLLNITCFCDGALEKQELFIQGKPVLSPKEAVIKYPNAVFIISVISQQSSQEIKENLMNMGVVNKIYALEDIYMENSKSVEEKRLFCAAYHQTSMNPYFETAETAKSREIFWNDNSDFYKMFSKLDLTQVVELACGRGRHVQHYIDLAGHIILVDILDKNIEYCKERFRNEKKISYYVNSGCDLKEIEDTSCSSLFTYDSMVHFESIDIYHYLLETYRILVKGGKALFHHSNNHKDYRVSFQTDIAGRNYMSSDLFAHFADRAGFHVVQQKIIDWGGVKESDTITLLEK